MSLISINQRLNSARGINSLCPLFINPFKDLSKFELILWSVSIVVVTGSFFVQPSGDILSLIASLIGVTALIFVAKGLIYS